MSVQTGRLADWPSVVDNFGPVSCEVRTDIL
jgi:hypothetical protein